MTNKKIKKTKTGYQPFVDRIVLTSKNSDKWVLKVHTTDFGFNKLANSVSSMLAFKNSGLTPSIYKYFLNRYNFFDRFDEGIQLDAESWFSVTPQAIADYLAYKLRGVQSIADLCCGSGGNTIRVNL